MKEAKSIFVLSVLLLAAGSLLPLLPGQTQPETEYLVRPSVEGTRGGNLVVAVNSDPPTFNRMLASALSHATVLDRISGTLVHINRLTYELEPSVATRWESSPDGRVFTIHLRRGLRFSDGSSCTAEDVLFSLQALMDPRSQAMLADQLKIDGTFPAIAKVNDLAIRVTFPRPIGIGIRALDSIPILPKQRLVKAFAEGKFASAWGPGTPAGEIAGLGPFRLREYQRGSRVVLERNPYYWKKDRSGQALPYLDAITFLIVPDRNAEALRFQAGEINLIGSMTPEDFASLRRGTQRGSIELRDLGPGLFLEFLWFNLNSKMGAPQKPAVDAEKLALFEKGEFRQAVSLAIDRDAIARGVLYGLGTPQYGPISSGNTLWHNPRVAQASYDMGRARNLLGKLGLRDQNGDGMLEFGTGARPLEIAVLTTRGNMIRERMAQVVKDYLGKVGIKIEVQPVPTNELIIRLQDSLRYEAILFGFTPMDVAPDLQADVWYSSGKNHFWNPEQPSPARPWEAQMDSLTTQLLRALRPETRKQLFFQLQDIWARELPAITLVAPNILAAWDTRLTNIQPSIFPPHLLWNAEELAWRPR